MTDAVLEDCERLPDETAFEAHLDAGTGQRSKRVDVKVLSRGLCDRESKKYKDFCQPKSGWGLPLKEDRWTLKL